MFFPTMPRSKPLENFTTPASTIFVPAPWRCARRQTTVRECIDFARRSKTPIHLRSGGHSYAGWSTGPGLVIDVSRMNQVRVDAGSTGATIGAGAS